MTHVRPILLLFLLATASFAAEGPSVGDVAPPLSADSWLQTPEGAEVSWEALRGKVVVLEFWGTWCGPCVAAIPHLNDLAEKFADEEVVFLSVTFEDEATIRPFLEKRPMRSWIGLDRDKSMPTAYGVKGWPTTVLVDKNGKVAAVTYPMSLTAKPLRDMLAGRPPTLHFRDREDDRVSPSDADSEEREPAWFELSIRPSRGERASFSVSEHSMTIEGQRLPILLPIAYEMRRASIAIEAELPGEPFDVSIRLPRGELDDMRRMLATALEQAFGFEAKLETRTTEVLVMTTGESLGDGLVPTVAKDGSSYSSEGGNGLEAVGIPAESIAGFFERKLERVLIDETGLEGRYDVRFRCEAHDADSIRAAAQAQLGLRFHEMQRDVEILVIRPLAASGE